MATLLYRLGKTAYRRWPWFVALIPALAFYVFLLFFTPAIGANGRAVLLEHPALTLPVPF